MAELCTSYEDVRLALSPSDESGCRLSLTHGQRHGAVSSRSVVPQSEICMRRYAKDLSQRSQTLEICTPEQAMRSVIYSIG